MEIPVNQITAGDISVGATQTVAAGFVATHNNKAVLLLTCDVADRASGAPHIQAGVKLGQLLTIIATDDANRITITDGAGAGTQLNGNWVMADGGGAGAWLKVVWDGTRWWEDGRGNGGLTASGYLAYAEGKATSAIGEGAHAEGYDTDSNSTATHAEGYQTLVSATAGHAEGRACQALHSYTHAEGYRARAYAESSHAQGYYTRADFLGQSSHACGRRAALGDAQYTRFILRGTFNEGAVPAWHELVTPERFVLSGVAPTSRTYGFRVIIVGRKSDGTEHALYMRETLLYRNAAGNATLVGAVQTIGTDIESDAAWDVQLTANAANQSLKIEVKAGANDGDVYWSATIESFEVG